ncbi:MAG TPA: PAS domain-containing protein, partial [Microcella sp.]|nr:PAS domain-containing protein [Microcella sp.]
MTSAPDGLDLLRIAGSMARFGGWSVDATTHELALSPEARTLLELPLEGALDFDAVFALHPDEWKPIVAAHLERCLSDGTPFDLESPMHTANGARLTVRTIGEPAFGPDGRIARAQGAVWDITPMAAERERSRALEERLEVTLNTISDGVFFLDHDGRFTVANDNGAAMVRHTPDELIGRQVFDVFPEAQATPFARSLAEALAGGQRLVTRAHYAPFDTTLEATFFPSVDGVAVYLKDVSDDERLQAELRRTSSLLAEQAALIEASRDAMVVRALDGRIRYWNRAAAELYGWPAGEVIDRFERELLYDAPDDYDAATEATLRDDYWSGEIDQRTRSGRALVAECRWQLLRDAEGMPEAIFAVMSDVTADRKAQEARLRAQRMESLGTLAGGIAHDLNNVLTPILMSVQLLEQGETDAGRREILATMEGAVKRGADMIRQVLSFARGVEGRRVTVSVPRLVDDVVSFARDTLPKTITIDLALDDEVSATSGDPTQLLQILINLVTNATDAMAEGGTLRIRTSDLVLEDTYSSISHLAMPGRYVAIEVEDTGHGMPPDTVEKIFEPFFTTKEVGKGTGLGLATSLAIVRSHGGFMQVYSEQGKGTRFTVGLPATSAGSGADARPAAPAPELPRGHGELVLVVDDEPSILQITCQTLELHGYRTLRATNGRDALDVMTATQGVVDLVLTDMMMPVMDGAALSAHLEEHHPELPVIAASGLNSNGGAARAVGMG